MRARYLLIGLVVVLTVVTGVLIYQGSRTDTTASESPVTHHPNHHRGGTGGPSPFAEAGPDGSSTPAATGSRRTGGWPGWRRTCR